MNPMEQKDIDILLVNYLAGKASEEEIVRLEEWIKSSSQNRTYFLQIKNLWETSGKPFEPLDISSQKAMQTVFNHIHRHPIRIWTLLQRTAAIFFIPFILGSFLWGRHSNTGNKPGISEPAVYNEVFAAYGTRSVLKLSDGSRVWLNSGSSLSYPDKFTAQNRVVTLKGEAYFEVQSDVSHPFIVQTQSVNVRATGTMFNVQAYTSGRKTQITLVKGKVSVGKGSWEHHFSDIAQLKPSQHLEYDAVSGIKELKTEDVCQYTAWKDGKLIFRKEPLKDVVEKISQLYNVEIELQGKDLQDYQYRATFQEESLTDILKLLKLSSPIDYREIKRNPLPDGSFPKKKIIIFSIKKNI
jgi:transmembrane sensor